MTSNGFTPHAVCWAGSPRLIWTMVVANSIIFLSYASNCGALLYIARRTFRTMVRDSILIVIGFALFIVACGSTHLMDVVTTWIPVFWINAWAIIITAGISAFVAITLIRRAPSISFAINDYATRLSQTEQEKENLRGKLLAARKLEDWSRTSASVTHEISNPLETIQNILHLIHTDPAVSPDLVKLASRPGTRSTVSSRYHTRRCLSIASPERLNS